MSESRTSTEMCWLFVNRSVVSLTNEEHISGQRAVAA